MRHRSTWVRFLSVFIGVHPWLIPSYSRAELPSPRLDRVTPLGAAAGSAVEVEVVATEDDAAATLRFEQPGITAAHVKGRQFKVTVAADVPAGTYDVRLVGRNGVSSPRLFEVSRGPAEVAEVEPNNEPATAQKVPVNCVVNGTSDSGNDDYFRFTAKKGQRVVVECRAQLLDSTLDGVLTLADAAGKPLASNGDYNGRDPLVEFVAPADGDYVVGLHDLSFKGGLPYRLLITDRPHVENVFPRAVQVGKSGSIAVFGRNLGPSARSSPLRVNDLPLDEVAETVMPPADLFAARGYRFAEHPTTHSVLPTAATATLAGFQVRGASVVLVDTPVSVEREPNDDPTAAQKLTLPAVVSGRFDAPRDADWYEFTTAEAGGYGFDVYSERIAGRADPYLVVTDDKGNRVIELDDFGIRSGAFDGAVRDPSGVVQLAANRTYRVLVQDRYRRGGPRFQYVLAVHRAEPDFYAAVIHRQSTTTMTGLNVRRGGAAYLDVIVHLKDGFKGPITLAAAGLPKGLHAAPTTLTNDTRGTFVVWADADAPAWVGPVVLTATAVVNGQAVRREVRPYTRVTQEQSNGGSRPTRELTAAVVPEPAPFALRPVAERVTVEAGKKVDITLVCDRPAADFKGAVTVAGLNLQGSIKVAQVTVPEGKGGATATVDVGAGVRPGEYTIAFQGQGQVAGKDAKGKGGLVTLPSRPVTLVVTGK